ncbi:hypothetical protein HYZ41_04050 [archaeon]|nr:hypothetical protein [archaeon]
MVGNAVSWIWNTTSANIRSGSPVNWAWRAFQSGSGRQIPNGSATYWNWKIE